MKISREEVEIIKDSLIATLDALHDGTGINSENDLIHADPNSFAMDAEEAEKYQNLLKRFEQEGV